MAESYKARRGWREIPPSREDRLVLLASLGHVLDIRGLPRKDYPRQNVTVSRVDKKMGRGKKQTVIKLYMVTLYKRPTKSPSQKTMHRVWTHCFVLVEHTWTGSWKCREIFPQARLLKVSKTSAYTGTHRSVRDTTYTIGLRNSNEMFIV